MPAAAAAAAAIPGSAEIDSYGALILHCKLQDQNKKCLLEKENESKQSVDMRLYCKQEG